MRDREELCEKSLMSENDRGERRKEGRITGWKEWKNSYMGLGYGTWGWIEVQHGIRYSVLETRLEKVGEFRRTK